VRARVRVIYETSPPPRSNSQSSELWRSISGILVPMFRRRTLPEAVFQTKLYGSQVVPSEIPGILQKGTNLLTGCKQNWISVPFMLKKKRWD